MNTPVPQTQAEEIWQRLTDLIDNSPRIYEINEFTWKGLYRDCERLTKTDVVRASLYKGVLHSLKGEDDKAETAFQNAALNGAKETARAWLIGHFANRGFASKAAAIAAESLENSGDVNFAQLMDAVATCGAFGAIVKAADNAFASNKVLTQMTTTLETSRRAKAVMDELHLTDADVSAAVDVAGEVLRENKLLWLHKMADIEVFDDECPFRSLMLQFHVAVTPEKAAAMCNTLTERLVVRDLDKPGLSVTFLGTELEAAA
jgi:hypothetical protein